MLPIIDFPESPTHASFHSIPHSLSIPSHRTVAKFRICSHYYFPCRSNSRHTYALWFPFFFPFLLRKGIAMQCNIRTRCFHCCSLAWLKASARPFVPSPLSPSHFIHFLHSIHSCQTRTLHARKPTKPNQCNDDDDEEEDKGGIANMKAKHKKTT